TEPEVRGHDADDFAADAIELNGASNRGGVAIESILPQRMTQDDGAVRAGSVLAGAERSAQLRGHAERREKPGGDKCAGQSDRLIMSGQIQVVTLGIRGDIHGPYPIAHCDKRAPW